MLDWTTLSWNFCVDFFETFKEGSVDHIIYRDYIANRRSFIYCSLACTDSIVSAGLAIVYTARIGQTTGNPFRVTL